VGSGTIRRYVDKRIKEGASNATINRELAVLRRAFTLGRKNEKVAVVPPIELLGENNRRTGFLETEQEARLAEECGRFGLWFRTAFEIGLTYGWRLSEIQTLQVRHVNLLKGILSLDVGTTKNNEGRTVVLTDTLHMLLSECICGKQPDDYVLTRQNHEPVRDFCKAWHRACCRAGLGRFVCPECKGEDGQRFAVDTKNTCTHCGRKWRSHKVRYVGLLFHDLRRSMARNMRNEQIAEEVIMKVGGWKTPSVFKRYSIVNPNDTAYAVRKSDAARQRNLASVTNPETSQAVHAEFSQNSAKTAQLSGQTTDLSSRTLKPAVLPN
jgi:integrase